MMASDVRTGMAVRVWDDKNEEHFTGRVDYWDGAGWIVRETSNGALTGPWLAEDMDSLEGRHTVTLNVSVVELPDYVGHWRGLAYVTVHTYGVQMHRTPDEAERWNVGQRRVRPVDPAEAEATLVLGRDGLGGSTLVLTGPAVLDR